MRKRQSILFFALSIVSSSLGWISLNFGLEGTTLNRSDMQSLGCLLIIFGAGYLLLSLALAMRGLQKLPYLSDARLAALISIAAFLSAFPLAITFDLADKPTILIVIIFILTWPPLSIYLSYRAEKDT